MTRPSYISSTLPRFSSAATKLGQLQLQQQQPLAYQQQSVIDPANSSPFQRNNNAYWTLQTRKQMGKKTDQQIVTNTYKDDFLVNNQNFKSIEELYSTPNKLKKRQPPDLRPTPLGFSTYFSPISKNNSEQIVRNDNLKISPIDPRNTGSFKTSTPSKATDDHPASLLLEDFRAKLCIQEGGSNSNVSSPISSGRSTPRSILEPQNGRMIDPNDLSQTCSDRLGAPKTTLMDFKKLLLSKAGKTPMAKPSAVEQLKLAKEIVKPVPAAQLIKPTANSSVLSILDLSGSPKTFASRRMIRQGNFGGSPSKTSSPAGKSPRSAWKYNNYRTDVMSTAIPEVNSEEDSSPNNSKERNPSQMVPPIRQDVLNTSADKSAIVEDNLPMKNNIFLQAEENNFMKGELTTTKPLSRMNLIQARSQFLLANNNSQPQSIIRSAQFKNGHYTGISPTRQVDPSKMNSIPELTMDENARVGSVSPTSSAPSLETAL